MRTFFYLFPLLLSNLLFSQELPKDPPKETNTKNEGLITFRGFIYEKETGEVVPFQKIKLQSSTKTTGSISDVNGFFSIPKLTPGEYTITIIHPIFNRIDTLITLAGKASFVQINFNLFKSLLTKELETVTISAENKQKTSEVGISVIKLDKKGLERIPSMGAENDIIGAFSVTPGVVTTGDQGGQMYVRGGTPIQNKILLDGMTIYTPFHSIGFFSVFETELIKNVDVYTGGFDAKYGGRISSIMDISYRDGNRKKFGGKISLSPFLGKIVLEGPIGRKNKDAMSIGTYLFTAKKSLLDLTSKTLYPKINNGDGFPFSFQDLYGKITSHSNGGSKFSCFGFNNTDSVNYVNLARLSWNQKGAGMNFILVPGGSSVFLKGHFNTSSYKLKFVEENEEERTSSIGGAELGFDFTYFQKNEGQFDVGITIQGISTNYMTYNNAAMKISDENFTFEIGNYLNYKKNIGKFVFQPGIRLQNYTQLNVQSLEPRFGIKFNAFDKIRFKFSGGKYSQNFTSTSSDKDVVNLFNGLLTAPSKSNIQNTLTLQNGNVKSISNGLQYSWHAILGTEIDLSKKLSLSIEGYFKYFPQLSNLNQNKLYPDTENYTDKPAIFKKDFIIETGESFGVDFLAKYTNERVFVWAVYSYGKSTRWDGLKSYIPVFDRRHNVNIVTTYLFLRDKSLELSLRWNLGSGLPFTPTSGFYQNETFNQGVTTNPITSNTNSISTLMGNFNSERLPYYHRLDITVKKNFTFKNKNILEFIGNITNSYDRKNIFYVNRVSNKKIYQFPLLPSFGISFKF